MGREVVRAVLAEQDLQLVAAVDRELVGADAGTLAACDPCRVMIRADLVQALADTSPEVMVDFTIPSSAMGNIRSAIAAGVSPVVGTTGLSEADFSEIGSLAQAAGVGALVAANFAIGAVLMMRFAAEAVRYMPEAEIIELHHDNKLDSPSGTAIMTARAMAAAREQPARAEPEGAVEKIPGGRGAVYEGIHIHSVRLPGYVAHQEVILGGLGQTLTLRHDSLDRRSFMPGVVLAVRKVRGLTGLAIGLDAVMG